MVEVIVAAIIIMGTVLAVFSTIAQTRKPIVDSDRRLRAAIYGKKVLDDLRGRVSSDMWGNAAAGTGFLADGTHLANDILADDEFGSSNYTVTDLNGLKRVSINVVYNATP